MEGLDHVIETLAVHLNAVTDLPDTIVGIPNEVDGGPHPRMYLGDPEEDYEYEDLHGAEDPTSAVAEVKVVVVLGKEDIVGTGNLLNYMVRKANEIRKRIQAGNDPVNGAFKVGDGFKAVPQDVAYAFTPNKPTGTFAMTVRIEAYF